MNFLVKLLPYKEKILKFFSDWWALDMKFRLSSGVLVLLCVFMMGCAVYERSFVQEMDIYLAPVLKEYKEVYSADSFWEGVPAEEKAEGLKLRDERVGKIEKSMQDAKSRLKIQ